MDHRFLMEMVGQGSTGGELLIIGLFVAGLVGGGFLLVEAVHLLWWDRRDQEKRLRKLRGF